MSLTIECNFSMLRQHQCIEWVQLLSIKTKLSTLECNLLQNYHFNRVHILVYWKILSALNSVNLFSQYSVYHVSKDVIILFFVKQFNNLSKVHLAQQQPTLCWHFITCVVGLGVVVLHPRNASQYILDLDFHCLLCHTH